MSPRNVFKNSRTKYFFDCDTCNHSYEKVLYSDTGCSFCNNKLLCDDENCIYCEQKSFKNNFKAQYWSDKNTVKPRNVFKSTHTKYYFDCPDCDQVYVSSPDSITRNNCWCSCTFNKTETKLFNFLQSTFDLQIEKQKKFEWCKHQKYLPFDYFSEKYNLIIELDGRQHFEQVSNWNCPENINKTDKYKMKCANDNGYSIIRIFQEDVWNDKNDWQNKLSNSIKKYDKVTNIFIGDIYTNSPFMQ
jgi:very-short-patch-repair endonuclease